MASSINVGRKTGYSSTEEEISTISLTKNELNTYIKSRNTDYATKQEQFLPATLQTKD